MKTMNVQLGSTVDYTTAERAAKEAAMKRGSDIMLLAWYDKVLRRQGPRETCAGEGWTCALSFAENHHADIRVSVNGGAYEFFFTKPTGKYDELSAKDVVDVHRGIARDTFDNVQGG
jgi:hypothetical protein